MCSENLKGGVADNKDSTPRDSDRGTMGTRQSFTRVSLRAPVAGSAAADPGAGTDVGIRWSGLDDAAGPVSDLTMTRQSATATTVLPGAAPLGSPLYGTLQGGERIDHGPLRATGVWSVSELEDQARKTIEFARIDDIESEIVEHLEGRDHALVPVDDEEKWKHKLMFRYKFKKTPKHLTWKELGQELECMDCVIELDEHRPEEQFEIKFYFIDKRRGSRDVIWAAKNDVSYSEGFTDLLAAIGSCLGRADVFRTIRFDDGKGVTREITIRKKSRFTSDILLSFRPPQSYNVYERKETWDDAEAAARDAGASTWGFHPQLMGPEYRDLEDPEGTYTITLSAHAFSFIMLRCIERLIERPMSDFYRPSQAVRRARIQTTEQIGLSHAVKGWLGVDEPLYMHHTPIEAVQEHWLGSDAPFTLVAIINKLREMTYLKKKNPEFQSWLSVRRHDTALAIRNVGVKMLGVGASTLFVPRTHNATVNQLLPKNERRRLESRISLNAMLGMPDETRNIAEFKKITGGSRQAMIKERSNKNNGPDEEQAKNNDNGESSGTEEPR